MDRIPSEGRRLPWLALHGPDGQEMLVDLAGPVRIGRDEGINDVALAPDPERWISRRHCRIEPEPGGWTVVDEGSTNGTYNRRGASTTLEEVTTSASIEGGDAVCLLARVVDDVPTYWEIVLHDPEMTAAAPLDPARAYCLEYDWEGGRAWLVKGGARSEVSGLRPQEHLVLRHMAGRNRAAGGTAVLCSYQELVGAVWGDDPHLPHTREELARLIYEIRRRLEGCGATDLIQTVRGLGYRLLTCSHLDVVRPRIG